MLPFIFYMKGGKKVGTEKITVALNNMKVYQIIGPGHYRPVVFSKLSLPLQSIDETLTKEDFNEPVEIAVKY